MNGCTANGSNLESGDEFGEEGDSDEDDVGEDVMLWCADLSNDIANSRGGWNCRRRLSKEQL